MLLSSRRNRCRTDLADIYAIEHKSRRQACRRLFFVRVFPSPSALGQVDILQHVLYTCIVTQMNKGCATSKTAACCDLAGILPPRFFKALGDPNRIALLARLAACGRPCGVTEMAACCPIDFSVTSRHLAILRDAGIIHSERCGKEVHYAVRFQEIATALRAMADALDGCCPTHKAKSKGRPR